MTGRRLVIRGILRVLRWLSWSSLATFAIYTIVLLETAVARGHLALPQIALSLTELFAVFCCAVATDRAFSLGEKSFDERD